MESTGVVFDSDKANALLAMLERDEAIYAAKLQEEFPPELHEEIIVPKKRNIKKGYYAGIPFVKQTKVPFNANSSQQIVARLTSKYNWQPTVFTDTGAPSTKATVLATLTYPEAITLCRFKVITKRLTMMTGPQGWLSQVSDDGRLHTQYTPLGTVTGRATHRPNISQVPKVVATKDGTILRGAEGLYGFECRELFGPTPGWYLVGADMSGLELRALAHFLGPYDNGAYARVVCEGDPHLITQQATGVASRARAKTLIYAIVYGCGDFKAGTIVEPDESDEYYVRMVGKSTKSALIDGIDGFRELFRWLDSHNGHSLPGLDGRELYVRKAYARLNTLLQSAGAIVCKRWLVLTEAALQAKGLHHGDDYLLHIWNHDESQHGARTLEIAEVIADVAKEQAIKAGEYYGLLCPTAGESKIGRHWADTH